MIKYYIVIHIDTGSRIGFISPALPGWMFISNVPHHKWNLKRSPTAKEALPQWAKKMGCEMVARENQ